MNRILGTLSALQSPGTFSYASSNFVTTMRTLFRQAVCSVNDHFQNAVVHEVADQKLFVAILSEFLLVVNRRVNVRSGVLCSTVVEMSPIPRFLFVLGFLFHVSVIFFLQRHRRGWMSFFVFTSSPTVDTFWAAFRGLIMVCFLTTVRGPARRWFAIVVTRIHRNHRLLWRIGDNILVSLHCGIRFTSNKSCNGAP